MVRVGFRAGACSCGGARSGYYGSDALSGNKKGLVMCHCEWGRVLLKGNGDVEHSLSH